MTRTFDPQLRALLAARLASSPDDVDDVMRDLLIEVAELVIGHRSAFTALAQSRVEPIEVEPNQDGNYDGAECDRKWRIEHERFLHECDLLRGDAARIALDLDRSEVHPLRTACELASVLSEIMQTAPNAHRTAIERCRSLFWDLHHYAGQGSDSLYARLPADIDAVQRARAGFDPSTEVDYAALDAIRQELLEVVEAGVPSTRELHEQRLDSYEGGRTSYRPYLREQFPQLGADLLVVLERRSHTSWEESISDIARLMIDEIDARQSLQHPRTLTHKGYVGTIDSNRRFSPRWLGRIVNTIRRIEYSGETIADLEHSMRNVVDEYLEACARQGLEPDPPGKSPLTGPPPLWDEHGNWL